MDLVDRYLRMLRFFLPGNQRDDITRELAEEIRSQATGMEEELGRPLTTDEQAGLLRKYGHPLLTAARYRPQQYLIGPVLFPYWWLALRVVLAIVVTGQTISMMVGDLTWTAAGQAAADLARDVGLIVAWFTVLGVVVDRKLVKSRVLEKWDPKKLAMAPHHVAPAALAARRLGGLHQDHGEPESLTGLIIAVVFSTWWLLALRFPSLMFISGAENIAWGPAMLRIYPILFVAQLATVAEHVMRYARSNDVRWFHVIKVVWFIAGVSLIVVMSTADYQWIVWRDTAGAAVRDRVPLGIANLAFSVAFGIAALGTAVSLLKQIWRWIAGGRHPRSPAVAR